MLFRSIFLAVAAFATVASAVPTPSPQGIPALGGILSGGAGGTTNSIGGSGDGTSSGSEILPLPRGQYNPSDSFKNCHEGLLAVVVKISLSFLLFFYSL